MTLHNAGQLENTSGGPPGHRETPPASPQSGTTDAVGEEKINESKTIFPQKETDLGSMETPKSKLAVYNSVITYLQCLVDSGVGVTIPGEPGSETVDDGTLTNNIANLTACIQHMDQVRKDYVETLSSNDDNGLDQMGFDDDMELEYEKLKSRNKRHQKQEYHKY